MAPIAKKTTNVSSGMTGKTKTSSSNKPSNILGSSKTTTSSSGDSKSYLSPNYTSSKNKKSSTSFGVIWIPTKRHNREKKDKIYNPHHNDRKRERSPSMYRLYVFIY